MDTLFKLAAIPLVSIALSLASGGQIGKSLSGNPNATITLDMFTNPGNQPFLNFMAFAQTGTRIDTLHSVGNRVTWTNVPTHVKLEPKIATRTKLYQNYPNAFNPSTTIILDIAEGGHYRLTVYNILGQKVKTLAAQYFTPGSYQISWDGMNENGFPTAAGVFFYRLQGKDFQETKKMLKSDGGGAVVVSGLSSRVQNMHWGTPSGSDGSVSQLFTHSMRIIGTDSSNTVINDTTFSFNVSGDTDLVYVAAQTGRHVTINLSDYINGTPINNVRVVTDREDRVLQHGQRIKAGAGDQSVFLQGPAHWPRGIVLAAGFENTFLIEFTVKADTAQRGLDSVYARGLVTPLGQGGFRSDPYILPGLVGAITDSSLRDTIWIYADQLIPGWKFRTIAQLNAMAAFINDTLNLMTLDYRDSSTIFGETRKIIAIADNRFSHPDSVSQFSYLNMRAVPENIAPLDLETRKNYIIILAQAGSGGESPYLKADNVTIKGAAISLPPHLIPSDMLHKISEELGAALMCKVESQLLPPYPSIYDNGYGWITQQDKDRQSYFIHVLKPGCRFPGFDPGFVMPEPQ